MTLVPAYGRDYKSKKEVEHALKSGQDFHVAGMGSGYINLEDLQREGIGSVTIRYAKLRKACVVKVPK